MLRKGAPPWSMTQTHAVQQLKQICQDPPPLKIPGIGERVLQTDASDDFWGAILIEKVDGKDFYCGHVSGQFKDAEKHYHTVYKEILAVKYGIKKFEFHLIGYHFTVLMDNSSFPKILDFKNKGLPEAQLLRLKDWFSKYQFTVRHIKGDQNLIPDLLSRPKLHPPQVYLITASKSLPLILMMEPIFTDPELSEFPTNMPIISKIEELHLFARNNIFYYQAKLFLALGYTLEACKMYPDYIFIPVLTLRQPTLPRDGYWYYWCLGISAWFAVEIDPRQFLTALSHTPPHNVNFAKFLYGYWTRTEWIKLLKKVSTETSTMRRPYTVLILHRPYIQTSGLDLKPLPYSYIWKTLDGGLAQYPDIRTELFQYLCHENKIRQPVKEMYRFNQLLISETLPQNPYFQTTVHAMSEGLSKSSRPSSTSGPSQSLQRLSDPSSSNKPKTILSLSLPSPTRFSPYEHKPVVSPEQSPIINISDDDIDNDWSQDPWL